jgi:hypothetical protein
MAGTIIVDKVQLDVGQDTLRVFANTGSTIFSANTLGINAASLGYGTLSSSRLPTGSVLQVVSTSKTDTFSSSSSGSWIDITGLSATITPTNSSNKILVSYSVVSTSNNGWFQQFRLVRSATAIGVGDTAGSRNRVTTYAGIGGIAQIDYPVVQSNQFLDSPSTTSATTYKLQIWFGGDTIYINRSPTDTDATTYGRAISTITVMEIAA